MENHDSQEIYEKGMQLYENDQKKQAMIYFQQAADLHNPDALYQLGQMYEFGEGIPVNFDKAINYYKQAGQLGHHEALYSVGNMYELGKGVKQDQQQALGYYHQAGKYGNYQGMNKWEKIMKRSFTINPDKNSSQDMQLDMDPDGIKTYERPSKEGQQDQCYCHIF